MTRWTTRTARSPVARPRPPRGGLAAWLVAAMLGCGGGTGSSAEETPPAADAPDDASPDAKGDGATPAPEPSRPEATAILERSIDAIGGKAALEKIRSFYYEGEIEFIGQNITGDVKIWWKDGDYYTEQNMEGVGLVRAGKKGSEIWAQDPMAGLRKLEGKEAEQHTWASSLQLAADWKRYFESAKTVGERQLDGKKVYDVELSSATGGKVTLTFDAESGLQVAQTFEQVTPTGPVPITVRMDEYRDVDGVKIAFRQLTEANVAKASQTITKIELNADVSDARFTMPRSGSEVVTKENAATVPAQASGDTKSASG